ncbi:hypothetical protein PHLCEN_2v11339 [Hermanssonia centrifuga]|uniref:C2H2-type domain-containing protein n=1 Tax=Hermanssonia centrifuga TaxID=98765 RepID=A0A2R6NKC2_9APHY|nr:hypothetical protein PHLCEN_2v11339 [Hermanssonia centrifuga]
MQIGPIAVRRRRGVLLREAKIDILCQARDLLDKELDALEVQPVEEDTIESPSVADSQEIDEDVKQEDIGWDVGFISQHEYRSEGTTSSEIDNVGPSPETGPDEDIDSGCDTDEDGGNSSTNGNTRTVPSVPCDTISYQPTVSDASSTTYSTQSGAINPLRLWTTTSLAQTPPSKSSIRASPCIRDFRKQQVLPAEPAGERKNSRIYKCLIKGCPWTFKHSGSRCGHMDTHFKDYMCYACTEPSCMEGFKRFNALNTHIAAKHPHAEPLVRAQYQPRISAWMTMEGIKYLDKPDKNDPLYPKLHTMFARAGLVRAYSENHEEEATPDAEWLDTELEDDMGPESEDEDDVVQRNV